MSCETWPIGSLYTRVTTVSMRDKDGVYDPFCCERMMLASEAGEYMREQRRNPYATTYCTQPQRWRGLSRG